MKAIQVKHTGGPEVLDLATDLALPTAKGNEAVVKIAASGVNFIDVYYREGRYKAVVPFVPGQEGAGEITAIGPQVKQLKVGERVAYTGVMGSYAEHAAVPGVPWGGRKMSVFAGGNCAKTPRTKTSCATARSMQRR